MTTDNLTPITEKTIAYHLPIAAAFDELDMDSYLNKEIHRYAHYQSFFEIGALVGFCSLCLCYFLQGDHLFIFGLLMLVFLCLAFSLFTSLLYRKSVQTKRYYDQVLTKILQN